MSQPATVDVRVVVMVDDDKVFQSHVKLPAAAGAKPVQWMIHGMLQHAISATFAKDEPNAPAPVVEAPK